MPATHGRTLAKANRPRTGTRLFKNESQIDSIFADLIDNNGALDSKKLTEMAEADQFRIVARWLSESGVPDCGFSEIQRVLDLLSKSGDPAKINLPADVHARRRAGRIFLEK